MVGLDGGSEMIVDAHNHPDWHGHDLTRFLQNMDRHGIGKTWLLTWESPPDEYEPSHAKVLPDTTDPFGPIPFSRVLSYAERAPDRFVLGFAPDPRRPDAVDRLEAAVRVHGVRVCGELKLRMMYDNPDAIRLFQKCANLRLPVTIHIDYEFETGCDYPRRSYWYGGGIEALERALAQCGDTVFIGHAPGFWAHISADGKHTTEFYPEGPVVRGGRVPELMRAHPNLYADLSAGSGFGALDRDHGFGIEFLSEFSDRVLFGRDYFDDRIIRLLDSLGLENSVLRKILGENAERLEHAAETAARALEQ